MQALSDLTPEQLEEQLTAWGCKPSHAVRLLRAYYTAGGAPHLDALALGHALRSRLTAHLPLLSTRIVARHVSADSTVKLLIALRDGLRVESVLMPGFRDGRAAGCISSQVGCAMRCDFCASTRDGLSRNLTTGEIVEQFLHLRSAAHAIGRRVASLVFMGMGEPMHNLDNVLPAIARIADPRTGSLGSRHITVSTVGIIPGIEALSRATPGAALAVSLHAPDDETRSQIVPTSSRWKVDAILSAARAFHAATGRIVNIEYCLLAGVNDSPAQAHLLATRMQGFRAHVNLIPYNAIGPGISGKIYTRPSRESVDAFLKILRDAGVVSHIRITRGDDVSAACGQLHQANQLHTLGASATSQRQSHA